jgi:hypothetical protein
MIESHIGSTLAWIDKVEAAEVLSLINISQLIKVSLETFLDLPGRLPVLP